VKYEWKGALPAPGIRTIRDMKNVLFVPQCKAEGPLYFMYRDLARSEKDRQWLKRENLRFDITVIPPRDLCGELVKTKGHYHPTNVSGTGYPELYEVFEGKALFLLQSHTLKDIVLVKAEKGTRVIVPPGYGHVTINPSSNDTLTMANIVSSAFDSKYEEYETLSGAAYYVMNDGRIVKNRHYLDIPPIRHIGPVKGKGVDGRGYTGTIYSLIGNHKALAFLNEPEKYLEIFKGLLKG